MKFYLLKKKKLKVSNYQSNNLNIHSIDYATGKMLRNDHYLVSSFRFFCILDGFLWSLKISLKDNLSATDYINLDFSRALLNKVDSVWLYVMRIPFKKSLFVVILLL